MKKWIIFTILLAVCLSVCSCSKKEVEQEHYEDVYEYICNIYGIEMTDELITLEDAKISYISGGPPSVEVVTSAPQAFEIESYIQYKHKVISYTDNMDCLVFDIEGYDNLKFYSFVAKTEYSICAVQTLIVDETMKDAEIGLNVGDDVSELKSKFPYAYDTFTEETKLRDWLKQYMRREEVDKILTFRERYEFMVKDGIFGFEIDENGKIISIEEIKLQ